MMEQYSKYGFVRVIPFRVYKTVIQLVLVQCMDVKGLLVLHYDVVYTFSPVMSIESTLEKYLFTIHRNITAVELKMHL